MATRTRGFEFISNEQYKKDFELEGVIKQPKRGSKESAGYDIFAPYDLRLAPGMEMKVPTGLRAYMQPGEVLFVFPRSGLGYYTRLANTIGVIDSDYYRSDNEGHIWIKIRNEGDEDLYIKQGKGFCQMIFMPFLLTDGDNFNDGEERNGGFGSTTK